MNRGLNEQTSQILVSSIKYLWYFSTMNMVFLSSNEYMYIRWYMISRNKSSFLKHNEIRMFINQSFLYTIVFQIMLMRTKMKKKMMMKMIDQWVITLQLKTPSRLILQALRTPAITSQMKSLLLWDHQHIQDFEWMGWAYKKI